MPHMRMQDALGVEGEGGESGNNRGFFTLSTNRKTAPPGTIQPATSIAKDIHALERHLHKLLVSIRAKSGMT